MVPVIVRLEEDKEHLSYKSDSEESQTSECSASSLSVSSSVSITEEEEEEEEEDSPAEDPKCWSSRVRRQPRRARYSTEESDLDWTARPRIPSVGPAESAASRGERGTPLRSQTWTGQPGRGSQVLVQQSPPPAEESEVLH